MSQDQKTKKVLLGIVFLIGGIVLFSMLLHFKVPGMIKTPSSILEEEFGQLEISHINEESKVGTETKERKLELQEESKKETTSFIDEIFKEAKPRLVRKKVSSEEVMKTIHHPYEKIELPRAKATIGEKVEIPLKEKPRVPMAEVDRKKEYVIHPDVVLEIAVYGEPDLNKTVRVAQDGTIVCALLNRVKVEGLTVGEVEDKLTALYKKAYLVNPQVSIFMKRYGNISIMGQVKRPGTYELKPNMRVIEAIAMAGGFTRIASRNRTRIIRTIDGKRKAIGVPADHITRRGDRSKNIMLEPGDVIVVPESFF